MAVGSIGSNKAISGVPSQPPPRISSGFAFIESTLASAVPIVKTSLFVVFTVFVMKTLSLVFGTKPNFDDLETLKKQFAANPLFVIEGILNLIDQDPKKAKITLLNIAKDWRAHPKSYVTYSKENQVGLISTLDVLLCQLCLTKEERDFLEKIHSIDSAEDLKEGEIILILCSTSDWEEYKEITKARIKKSDSEKEKQAHSEQLARAMQAREKYEIIQQKEANFQEIFVGAVHAILLDQFPDFTNSNLYSKDRSPLKKRKITLGVVIERLINDHGFPKLTNKEIYGPYSAKVNMIIQKLIQVLEGSKKENGSLNGIKELINNIHTILSDEKKNHELWLIISDLIESDLDEKESPSLLEKMNSAWYFLKSVVKM